MIARGEGLLPALTRASERARAHGRRTGETALPPPEESWWTSPELVSLAGTAAWARLSLEAQRRLSFFEAVAFFSLNVHNERRLVAGAEARLRQERAPEVVAYLRHFIAEERDHTAMFEAFCRSHGGGLHPDRTVPFLDDRSPEEQEWLFYARVLVFEEMVDHLNVRQARDSRLPEAIRDIHRRHHRDEARHLVFGREMVERLWRPRWTAESRAELGAQLRAYVIFAFRELFSVDAYRAAGLPAPLALRREALASPAAAARFAAMTARPRAFFATLGLCLEAP